MRQTNPESCTLCIPNQAGQVCIFSCIKKSDSNLALQTKQSTDNRVRNLWLDTLDDDCLTSEDDYEEEDVDAEDQDGGGANHVDVSGDKHI